MLLPNYKRALKGVSLTREDKSERGGGCCQTKGIDSSSQLEHSTISRSSLPEHSRRASNTNGFLSAVLRQTPDIRRNMDQCVWNRQLPHLRLCIAIHGQHWSKQAAGRRLVASFCQTPGTACSEFMIHSPKGLIYWPRQIS